MFSKVSLNIQDVLTRSTGRTKSKGCRSRLVSSKPQEGLWRFRVYCTEKDSRGGGHEVNLWLEPNNGKSQGQLEFKASCDCRAWKYYGSDYNAKSKDYLYGRPKSNGSPPNIRDPLRRNQVCKHVYLCLTKVVRTKDFHNESESEDVNE